MTKMGVILPSWDSVACLVVWNVAIVMITGLYFLRNPCGVGMKVTLAPTRILQPILLSNALKCAPFCPQHLHILPILPSTGPYSSHFALNRSIFFPFCPQQVHILPILPSTGPYSSHCLHNVTTCQFIPILLLSTAVFTQ